MTKATLIFIASHGKICVHFMYIRVFSFGRKTSIYLHANMTWPPGTKSWDENLETNNQLFKSFVYITTINSTTGKRVPPDNVGRT